MQNILDFATREPITTMIIAAAVVCVLAALAITRHRRRASARREAELPPLVFAVHDRTVSDLRPAGFRGQTPHMEAAPRTDAPPSPSQRRSTDGERPAAAQRPASGDAPVRVPRYEERGTSRESSSEAARRR